MNSKARITIYFAGVIGLALVVWLILARNCPTSGLALTSNARRLHQLKNRTTIPNATDFDSQVTLDELLKPGNDTARWSTQRAARIEGYVADVAYARPEATNCFSPCRRDIHVLVANRKNTNKNEQVVLEVTPNLRDWATQQGLDWSEETLQSKLVDHWVQFEGWLYFDEGHTDQSENTAAHNPTNWRATAWEIHPVTGIQVIR